ncbi:hypothetical protein SAMN05428967_1819 [Phyllobacterium sp. YR620]|uniref:PIN-like domain-containing protein n=1 Tax=Phyllobacterium sp. YR620 TaxID=1881066 RepID=UPI00088AD47E|nr:hypothetical protein [Phyllobacterium sp. YR620]SDP37469.1 hypothetical protein SAMN05428967_1819 [Phyllobacterium sp. YR620]
MNVLFDNCISTVIAPTLHGFINNYGDAAFHIKDVPGLPNGRHSADIEWIDHLRKAPEKWIFVSGDGRVLKNPGERAALRSAGLHGFILAPAYQRTPLNQVAATLVWRLPEMLKITQLLAAPSMHEIPIGKLTKLRQLPV